MTKKQLPVWAEYLSQATAKNVPGSSIAEERCNIKNLIKEQPEFQQVMEGAMKEYAKGCIKASLEKAAENACTGVNERWDLVDADSITSEDNIVLL